MIMISRPSTSGRAFVLLLWFFTGWDQHQSAVAAFDYQAGVSCSSDADCENSYRKGSFCLSSGVCSNPFHSGCLNALFPEDDRYRIRHCNSHDDEIDDPKCQRSDHRYPEINIYNQDWEVALFFSWIYQIVLSEVLNVPVRVGLGRTSANLTSKESLETSNFYSLATTLPSMDGPSYPWYAIRRANELRGDCSLTEEDCIHIIPDVWMGHRVSYEREYKDGQIDYLDGNGQVGKVSWYVPKRTAQRYPFTVTYLGLKENRERLAEIFHRPVSWRDYCHQISTTNCSQPDKFASRYPETMALGNKYFYNDGYNGHFRPTDQNNCSIIDANSTSMTSTPSNLTCTGHIVNVKCSWSTFLESQAYWNDIALESNGPDWINGGYGYDDIVDIWRAANATNSDVISYFFEPDFASEQFRDTDYEYTKVILPAATIQCRDSRVPPSDRCSADATLRRGSLEGSCDDNAHATKKVVAMSLRDSTMATPDADQSPAYAFVRNFNMDELELRHMLQLFSERGQTGHAARSVVCEWVGNNTDYISSFIPPSHPRNVLPKANKGELVDIMAIAVGAFAVAYVLLTTAQMYKKRNMKVFMYAQVKFIFVVMFGLLLVAAASLLYVAEPTDVVCTAEFWLVAIGYTCMLVPLIIKVSAMNQLMRASARMRRVRIRTKPLYAKVLAWVGLVAIYLTAWTVADPPRPIELRSLSDDRTTIFTETGCMSGYEYWLAIYLGWEMIMALTAFVLAFQSRNAKAEFNESKSLGLMIYSHLGFACLRIIVFNVLEEDDIHLKALGTSFLLSLDVIFAVTIYLLPKFYLSHEFEKERPSELQASATVRQIQLQAESSSFDRSPRSSNAGRSSFQSSRQSSFRSLRQSSVRFASEEMTEGSDPQVEDTDNGGCKVISRTDSQKRLVKEESDGQIEMAKEPIIEEDENDLLSSTSLRHRGATGKASSTGTSPRQSTGELGFRSSLTQSASNRSVKSSSSFRLSATGTSFRRSSVAQSLSDYGRTSISLLFGPTTELEVIQSMRELPSDSPEDEEDLDMVSENDGVSEYDEEELNDAGVGDSRQNEGARSPGGTKIWTRNSQSSMRSRDSDDSITSEHRKNEHVMAA